MSRSRVLALAKRIVIQFRRDRRTLGMLFIVPILVLSLLSYLLNIERGRIPVGVVNEEGGTAVPLGMPSLAQWLLEEMQSGRAFKISVLKREEVDSWLKSGMGKAVFILPEDFTQRLLKDGRTSVGVILEGSEPQVSAAALKNLGESIRTFMARLPALASGMGQAPRADPINLDIDYIYGGEKYNALDYFAPTVIAIYALVFVFLLTVVSLLRERTQGTIERLMASPITRVEIVLGYMLGFNVFALLQSLIILLFSVYALKIHFVGNLFIVFIVVLIITVGAVNLGIFLSVFAKNELQAVQFVPMIIIPQILLGGAFWSVGDMHPVLQWIAHLLPITYANWALREVMIKGHGLLDSSVALNILALALFAGLFVVLAAFTLRREVA